MVGIIKENICGDLNGKETQGRGDVCMHVGVARIEVEPGLFALVLEMREDVVQVLKGIGFAYVAVDLQGYRTGSLNERIMSNV